MTDQSAAAAFKKWKAYHKEPRAYEVEGEEAKTSKASLRNVLKGWQTLAKNSAEDNPDRFKPEGTKILEDMGIDVPARCHQESRPTANWSSQIWAPLVPSVVQAKYSPFASRPGEEMNCVRPLMSGYEFALVEMFRKNEATLLKQLVKAEDVHRTILFVYPSFEEFIVSMFESIVEQGRDGKLKGKLLVILSCHSGTLAPALSVLARKFDFEFALQADTKQLGYVLDKKAVPDLVAYFDFDENDVPQAAQLSVVPLGDDHSGFHKFIADKGKEVAAAGGFSSLPRMKRNGKWELGAHKLAYALYCYGGTMQFAREYAQFLKSLKPVSVRATPKGRVVVKLDEILHYEQPFNLTKVGTQKFKLWTDAKPINGECMTNFLFRNAIAERPVRRRFDAETISAENTDIQCTIDEVPCVGDTGTYGCFYAPFSYVLEPAKEAEILDAFRKFPKLKKHNGPFHWEHPEKGHELHIRLPKHLIKDVKKKDLAVRKPYVDPSSKMGAGKRFRKGARSVMLVNRMRSVSAQ